MATNILMPALSPTMEQGKLAKWLKNEGDAVKPGDPIAEIETDKATMEVEAVDEGTLAKILIAAGTDNVAVNTPIAVLAGEARGGGGGLLWLLFGGVWFCLRSPRPRLIIAGLWGWMRTPPRPAARRRRPLRNPLRMRR